MYIESITLAEHLSGQSANTYLGTSRLTSLRCRFLSSRARSFTRSLSCLSFSTFIFSCRCLSIFRRDSSLVLRARCERRSARGATNSTPSKQPKTIKIPKMTHLQSPYHFTCTQNLKYLHELIYLRTGRAEVDKESPGHTQMNL